MTGGEALDARGIPSLSAASVPTVSAEQMREVDRVAVERFGLLLIQMMENAGARLAELATRRFGPASVEVLCGAGGNGGGGLVAARHLAGRGVAVGVTLADPQRLGEVPRHQLSIVERAGIPIRREPHRADLVLDALVGYSLRGRPHGRVAELIRWAGSGPAPVLSLDVPSGLDATTGEVSDPCVQATATMALALPKTGSTSSPEHVGELYLADLSIPPAVYTDLGLPVGDVFASAPLLRLV